MEREGQYIRLPEQGQEIARARLSPELARENSTVYKARLINLLPSQTVHTEAAWLALCERGNCHLDRLIIDPSTWVSQSTGDKIILGAAPTPAQWKANTMFEEHRFQGEREKIYTFSHELSHKLLGAINSSPQLNRLLHTFMQMRSQTGKGLSGMGSQEFYLNREQQLGTPDGQVRASEDLVELVNVYLLDPEYLRRFFTFLSDPAFKVERERLKLTTLDSEEVKDYIYQQIQHTVWSVIGQR